MSEILRGAGVSLQHNFYLDGVATDPDGMNATVTVTRADGTILQPTIAVARAGIGDYRYPLAAQSTLDSLTATWAGTFTGIPVSQDDQVEIVGGLYISINQMKAIPDLATRTTNDLLQARREFEDIAEPYCGVAFVPRFQRDRLVGNDRGQIQLTKLLPTRLLAVSIDGSVLSTSGFDVTDHGRLVYKAGLFPRSTGYPNIVVAYEHGYPYVRPRIFGAARDWIRRHLLQETSAVARDAIEVNTPDGNTTRYSTANWDQRRPTGLLEVDSALNKERLII